MAVTVTERYGGRKQALNDRERHYIIYDKNSTTGVYNALDENAALTAFFAQLPATLDYAPLIVSQCAIEEIAPNIYEGSAHWAFGKPDNNTANSFSIGFDISGTNQKVTQSLTTVNKYTIADEYQYDFKGAIGVNEDHSIDGVDILIPQMTFTIQYTVLPSAITTSYIGVIRDLVGKQNGAAFKGFEAGELLLTKVSGSRRDRENWDLNFGFAVSKNATGLTIGSGDAEITGIDKKGWDYLWVYYLTQDIKDGSTVIGTGKLPYNAFVERVYPVGDYSALGIPSGLGLDH